MAIDAPFRVLSLDGGGAKGFYTLGVLDEVEAAVGKRLCEHFDLIYGTSTGSIIAALLSLGFSVDEIRKLYSKHVGEILNQKNAKYRSEALRKLAIEVFGDTTFDNVKTNVGLVTARWSEERPMIFKGNPEQAFGRKATFAAGFGVSIGDAVVASCSAFPYFDRVELETNQGNVELVDGGYCANNPSIYALTDAAISLEIPSERIRLLSIGVGEYPSPSYKPWQSGWWAPRIPYIHLLMKTFEFSSRSTEQLRSVLFRDIKAVRVSEAFAQKELAVDMLEHDASKLDLLWQRGKASFGKQEADLKKILEE